MGFRKYYIDKNLKDEKLSDMPNNLVTSIQNDFVDHWLGITIEEEVVWSRFENGPKIYKPNMLEAIHGYFPVPDSGD